MFQKLIPLLTFLLYLPVLPIMAQDQKDTRLLHDPAISAQKVAFIYAEDLWVANRDGSSSRRLTIDEGIESNPVFSPDGHFIAFTAEYDGNRDVYIVPTGGGIPKRLTWHPGWDLVQDFSPDGRSVLFISQRATHTNRHAKLYTVPLGGGQPTELPIPQAFNASYSEDGKFIAYNPLFDAFNQWKNYRGGRQSRIWIYNTNNHEVVEVPKPAGGSNDADPDWVGETLYFKSDRDGEFNLYSFTPRTKSVARLTNFEDFPVLNLSANGSDLVFEQAGYLHTFDPESGTSKKVSLGIAADLLELRPRYVSGNSYIRSASISPSGARAVFDFRGDIVTVPAKKGDPANITQSQGAHEVYPQWSPDGKYIAYFSDASGEYQLHIQDQDHGNVIKIDLPGTGFYAYPHWSPDSRKICYVDNGRNLYWVDINSRKSTKIATDPLYSPGAFRELFGSWSHDSNWLTYTVHTETNFLKAYAYSLPQETSHSLSDGLANVTEPVFDPSGKYIYMLASTDAGPVVNWFDQSGLDMEMTNSLYLVTLQKDSLSPLRKQNDVEKINGKKEAEHEEEDADQKPKPSLKIDWENIHERITDIPVKPGMYSGLSVPKEGTIYYLSRSPRSTEASPQALMTFNLEERKEKEELQLNWYEISSNGKKMLYRNGDSWSISDVGEKSDHSPLKTDAIAVKMDPLQEWPAIFNEAWRVNRDYFYDPGMHGLDWEATRAKYKAFLSDLSCKSDLYRVMQWMFSELAVGHHYTTSRGDSFEEPEEVDVGLLGADYVISNNRFQFSKIYGGLNWTPELRSPLTEPGVNIREGDFLIAVNGENVTSDKNVYSYFENTAGKIVELSVSANADGNGLRKVKVVPLANESALRNRAWVEGNIAYVDKATNGQVAYVYVPNTANAGHEYFKRYFFPQANKRAIIVDERYNGGGLLADYYIDILKKPYLSYWNFRYGQDLKTPSASIQGPKVMLIDETAGSGGDYLPWMFRKLGLGPLVGKRTWGGLVGILGYPEFIDGGAVTAPNLAFWNEDGFGIENVGIAPDIEVEQWPKEVMSGKDPQLEAGIKEVLRLLKENPPVYPERPPYPVRVRKED